MNKCDLVEDPDFPKEYVCISAKDGKGLSNLKARILDALKDEFVRATLYVPYARSAEFARLRPLLFERKTEYDDSGMSVEAIIPAIHAERFRDFRKM